MRKSQNGMDSLRLAEIEDIPALNELIAESARGLSARYYTAEQIEAAVRYIFGVDTQLIIDRTYYLITRGPVLIACGGWSRRRTLFGGDQAKGRTDPLLDPATEAARIRAFFVHPDVARQGLGARLMRTCLAAVVEFGFQTLELVATLPGAPLYEAFGFVSIERFSVKVSNGVEVPIVRMHRDVR